MFLCFLFSSFALFYPIVVDEGLLQCLIKYQTVIDMPFESLRDFGAIATGVQQAATALQSGINGDEYAGKVEMTRSHLLQHCHKRQRAFLISKIA